MKTKAEKAKKKFDNTRAKARKAVKTSQVKATKKAKKLTGRKRISTGGVVLITVLSIVAGVLAYTIALPKDDGWRSSN